MNIVIMVRTIPLATFVFSSRRLVQTGSDCREDSKTNILFVLKMDHNLSQNVAVVDRVLVH